jgi:hypothetical protein
MNNNHEAPINFYGAHLEPKIAKAPQMRQNLSEGLNPHPNFDNEIQIRLNH